MEKLQGVGKIPRILSFSLSFSLSLSIWILFQEQLTRPELSWFFVTVMKIPFIKDTEVIQSVMKPKTFCCDGWDCVSSPPPGPLWSRSDGWGHSWRRRESLCPPPPSLPISPNMSSTSTTTPALPKFICYTHMYMYNMHQNGSLFKPSPSRHIILIESIRTRRQREREIERARDRKCERASQGFLQEECVTLERRRRIVYMYTCCVEWARI